MSATREHHEATDRAPCGLLPLSKDPFQAPTDRDMLPSERREFVRTHRTCVFGYGRQTDGPAMSIVYYIPADNDDLFVATMADRAKAKAVARNGRVSLCVLDETLAVRLPAGLLRRGDRGRRRDSDRRDDGGG